MDIANNKWKWIAELNENRCNFDVIAIKDALYVFGGMDGKDFLDSIEVYDETLN